MIRFEDVHWGGSTRLGSERWGAGGGGERGSRAESRQLGCCFIKISPRPSRETNSSNVPAKQFKTLSRFVRAESHLGAFSDTILEWWTRDKIRGLFPTFVRDNEFCSSLVVKAYSQQVYRRHRHTPTYTYYIANFRLFTYFILNLNGILWYNWATYDITFAVGSNETRDKP